MRGLRLACLPPRPGSVNAHRRLTIREALSIITQHAGWRHERPRKGQRRLAPSEEATAGRDRASAAGAPYRVVAGQAPEEGATPSGKTARSKGAETAEARPGARQAPNAGGDSQAPNAGGGSQAPGGDPAGAARENAGHLAPPGTEESTTSRRPRQHGERRTASCPGHRAGRRATRQPRTCGPPEAAGPAARAGDPPGSSTVGEGGASRKEGTTRAGGTGRDGREGARRTTTAQDT